MKFSVSALLLAGTLVLLAGQPQAANDSASAITDARKAALHSTIETCGTCHGVNGRSVSPTFPNLAAQQASYIELQLHAFKEQTRADPDAQAYMWGMAAQLSDSTISELAAYFASQPAADGKSGNPAMIAQGKHLFEVGVPANAVPPCSSCHGASGAGMANFPRLAGQHAPYLLKQLLVIQSALRTAPVMHGVVKDLNREQMEALVAYLASI
jgi:cytochrome c553